MRTRNSENPKPAASQKKTPIAKKAAGAKSQSQSTTSAPSVCSPAQETATPKSSKRTPPAKVTPAKTPDEDPWSTDGVSPSSGSKMETPVEETDISVNDQPASTTKRVTRRVVRKKAVRKTPTSRKAAVTQTLNLSEPDKDENDELPEEVTTYVQDAGSPTKSVAQPSNLSEPDKDKTGELLEETTTYVKNVESLMKDEVGAKGDLESPDVKEQVEPLAQVVEDIVMIQEKGKAKVDGDELPNVDPEEANRVSDSVTTPVQSKESEVSSLLEMNEAQQEEEERKSMPENENEPHDKLDDMNEVLNEETKEKGNEEKDDEDHAAEEMVEYGEDEAFIDPSEDDFQEDDGLDNVDKVKTSEEEHMELTAALKERKIRRELEVFVGGLDRDVIEDDVKNAFEKVGEVVEVRLLKDPSTNRNRGFAFVRFANKQQANRALSEMRNPVILGKRCGTAPSEDNDVLFLGNICNTWTKEAIKQKLKDYAIEGVESITLVQDPRHEGLSRGFSFVQFSCHADAMVAYNRLQKPDAIFGHPERSAKVAFAEPLQELDPEVMAKVKSVFIDGLPPHWDEDHVREKFKCYGEIERITLARNMPSAKRKDFGFVDFSTHEAAIACIEDVNKRELRDGGSKARVRARLSNPMPKTQAVKGGMCGGFRIGRGGGGVLGRGLGRGNRPFDRPNFQYGQPGFHQHGRGQFTDPMRQYPDFHDRRQFSFGGRRAPSRGHHLAPSGRGNIRNTFNQFNGPRQGFIDRGPGRPPAPLREPFLPEEEGYVRPFMGRYMDDPHPYNERAPGMKRPFYMGDQDHGYMEPGRVRPRFDYPDPSRGNQYRDTYGSSSSMYSSGYYGPDVREAIRHNILLGTLNTVLGNILLFEGMTLLIEAAITTRQLLREV